jgi:hypothetical protein
MAHFCSECGGALSESARFCPACGAAVMANTQPERAPSPVNEPPILTQVRAIEPAEREVTSPYASDVNEAPPRFFDRVRPFFSGAGALAILGGFWWFYTAGNTGPTASAPEVSANNTVDAAPSASSTSLFVLASANLRNKPTTLGSTIVAKLARGTRLDGAMEVGADGTSQWFKLADGRGFVSAVNLSSTEPPTLVRFLNKSQALGEDASVYAGPDDGAAVLQSVPKGTVVQLVGITDTGFAEISLKKGGMGYLAPLSVKSLTDRPVGSDSLVQFKPATCDFGPELALYFDRVVAAQKKHYAEAEAKTYASEEAKDDALLALEDKISFVPVNKVYKGLTLANVGLRDDRKTLHFAASKANVITVFRMNGFRISDDGAFERGAGDATASIYTADPAEAAQGLTVIVCGA